MSDLDYLLGLLPDNTEGAITAEHMREIVTALHGDITGVLNSLNAWDAAFSALNDKVSLLDQSITNVSNELGTTQTQVQQNSDNIGTLQGDVGGLMADMSGVLARLDALDGGT
jgi:hypothetical protein